MIDKYDNIFYVGNINSIGGVESWLYYIAKKYKYNIAVVYQTGDLKQILRLKKYCKVIKYNNEIIKCKHLFYCYWQNILDNVEAEEYIYVCHGDMKQCKEKLGISLTLYKKTTKVLAVSKLAQKSLKEAFNYDSEVCYNPVELDEPKPLLKLVSATRLTKEKGLSNMKKLANELEKSNIPYIWTIFTNAKVEDMGNTVFLKPRLDITPYIKEADYLVQLSEWESDGLSVKEALSLGTKVIVSDIPAFHESGVVEGENGYYFPIDIKKVYEDKDRKIKYTPPQSDLDKYIYKSKPVYEYTNKNKIKVKCIHNFSYSEINTIEFEKRNSSGNSIIVGDIFYIIEEQFDYLSGNNTNGSVVVDFIEVAD